MKAFALAIGSAHAQYSQYGSVEKFYQANPDINTGQYAGQAGAKPVKKGLASG
jgi:hypothetical protein